MSADYADWLRSNPAPDLQELVRAHGSYDKITPEAWAEYDRAARWRIGRSVGDLATWFPQVQVRGAQQPRKRSTRRRT